MPNANQRNNSQWDVVKLYRSRPVYMRACGVTRKKKYVRMIHLKQAFLQQHSFNKTTK